MEWRFAWKGEPLHRLRRSPSPRGEALGMGKFGVEVGLIWEVGPLHHLRWSPSPRGEAILKGRRIAL